MASSAETKKAPASSLKIIIIAGIIVIAVLLGVVIALLARRPVTELGDENVPKIGYSTDAKVMLDQNSLQAAMDEAMKNAEDGNVALLYKNNAYSENGTDFSCYIVNSASNKYDMFLTIFADGALTDQLFLSGLIPPGSGFESVTLDRALESGDHTVNVVVTQVDTDEDGEQVIKNQVAHTMEFHVE